MRQICTLTPPSKSANLHLHKECGKKTLDENVKCTTCDLRFYYRQAQDSVQRIMWKYSTIMYVLPTRKYMLLYM